MDASRRDELAIEAYRLIRDDLAREYGSEIVLVDNLQFLKLVIRSRRGGDVTKPVYRIALLFKPSKVSIIRRQAGHLAGEAKRIDQEYGETHHLREQLREVVNGLIADERLRQIKYRQIHP